ncbi:hypothetical protein [Tomitella cavernea]|uniref:DUF8176 domain-containing protein n=1 Tax=Tomitella cavernea TaxID=1387982 RepID=A0ABP9D2G3_9ACTN|nr:hypothetical protein [Tomitella cavernea]
MTMTQGPIIDDLGAPRPGRGAEQSAAERPRRTVRVPWRRPPRRLLTAVVVAALTVVACVYAVGALIGSGDSNSAVAASSPAGQAGLGGGAGADPAAAGCAAPAGDVRSGVGVIRALEHAYYVARDGAAVRALIADGTPAAGPAETIQAGIDTIPPGTTYCLAESQVSPTLYAVSVTEHRPGGDTVDYEQTFQVRKAPDGTWAVVKISNTGGRGA